MNDLFPETIIKKPRARPLKRAHVYDAGSLPDGQNGICFRCSKCGWDSGWLYDTRSVTENKRGIPCPECNQPKETP